MMVGVALKLKLFLVKNGLWHLLHRYVGFTSWIKILKWQKGLKIFFQMIKTQFSNQNWHSKV
jgi:hypothetical protein